jgi:hypothetical protein
MVALGLRGMSRELIICNIFLQANMAATTNETILRSRKEMLSLQLLH